MVKKQIPKFCLKCHRILPRRNTCGYCYAHRYFADYYRKAQARETMKWRLKNPDKYKLYQDNYRLKKRLSLKNDSISLNTT